MIMIDAGDFFLVEPSDKYWNELDGKIGRSLRFDTRNQDGKLGMVSIIIDAKKPIVIGEK